MIRRPPRSTLSSSSAASDVYKRQTAWCVRWKHRTEPSREHIHGSNRTVFSRGPTAHTLLLRCLHPDCTGQPLQVNWDAAEVAAEERSLQATGQWVTTEALPTDVDAAIAAELRQFSNMHVVEVDLEKLDCTRSVELASFARLHMHSPAERSVAFLQSQQGTGKTEMLLHQLTTAAQRDPQAWRRERALWLSTRRNYANSLGERIRVFEREHFRGRGVVDGLQFADYTEYRNDAEGNAQMLEPPRLILSLESLARLQDATGQLPHFQRIVLDELE